MPDLTPPALPGADVLLVDDRPSNLLALEAVLDGLGDHFFRAASGEEALRLLADRDFAVVLLDVQMPGLNGFETAKQCRALDRSRHTPVIFLSAAESDEFPVAEAYRLGAVDYLLKPFAPDVLRAKVAVFVELFRRGERVRELERREGEERLRVALDAGQTGVWEWDIGTGRITWSDRVAGFYGMVPGEFDGTFEMFARHLHPDDAERAREAIRASVEDGVPYRIEYRILRRDGEVRWIYTTGGVVRDPAGRPVRMHGATIDVTDRRRAEDELAAKERWLRTVTDSVPTLIAYVRADHRFGFANRAFLDWFGVTPEEIVGRHVRDVLGEDVYAHRRAYIEAALRGVPARFDGPNHHRALGLRETAVTYVPHAPDGAIDGFFVLAQDVTDRKAGEAALRASEERLRRMVSIDGVGVLIFEASTGTLIDANDAFLRASGYARGEVAARALTWRTMTPPEHVAESERQMAGFAATGRTRRSTSGRTGRDRGWYSPGPPSGMGRWSNTAST